MMTYRSYLKINPSLPTAQPLFLDMKSAYRFRLVLLPCSTQIRPPSPERKMIPPRPTIQPSFSLTNWTLNSVVLTGEVTLDQTTPPLLVVKIVPRSPAVHPCFSLRKST